jgi:hypothetical protein
MVVLLLLDVEPGEVLQLVGMVLHIQVLGPLKGHRVLYLLRIKVDLLLRLLLVDVYA